MTPHSTTLLRALIALLLVSTATASDTLPFSTVFKGRSKFDNIVAKVSPQASSIKAMPIGERVAWFGQLLVGTPYKSFTLEIDDNIEAPSVNLDGLDCWTFFESALAFARMAELPPAQWTPQTLLGYIELDRYRNGQCNGSYLNRLHYLEDWAQDNERRGLMNDLTRNLGGINVSNSAIEMTHQWQSYRYMRNNPSLRSGIAAMETRLREQPLPMIPLSRIRGVESKLQSGDIISIVSEDGDAYGTSHVGLALRKDGVLHFMHASSPKNFGKVVIDDRLSDYVKRYSTNRGIMVARPVK
jgi:hypothetical protein